MVNYSLSLLQQLLGALTPYRCILCHQQGQAHLDLCAPCQQDLPSLTPPFCRICALPLESKGSQQCGNCLIKPPSFNKLVALWQYNHPVDELINQFKSQNRLSYGRVLSFLLSEKIKQEYSNNLPELIIPTPLHWKRLLSRGYNQTEIITKFLSGSLCIPTAHPVKRQLHTPKQQGLSAKKRHSNLKQAFTISTPDIVANKRIALVDDVVTTGTTAELLSQCLKQAGAKEVHIWSLARTPLHN